MMVARRINISVDELELLIKKAVRDEFSAIGLHAEDAEKAEKLADDFRFLRSARQSYNAAAAKIGGALLLFIVSAFVAIFGLGFKAMVLDQVAVGKPVVKSQ